SKAVRAVLSGYTYFPEVVLSSINQQDLRATEAQCIARLSDREVLILQQLARGLSNKAIGEAMLLSNKTISTYKMRLIEKLRVKSLIDLADLARRNLLI
ncbi:LuxR C-terminal-related transcriptional regulator, partial [Pseudomonas sp.]